MKKLLVIVAFISIIAIAVVSSVETLKYKERINKLELSLETMRQSQEDNIEKIKKASNKEKKKKNKKVDLEYEEDYETLIYLLFPEDEKGRLYVEETGQVDFYHDADCDNPIEEGTLKFRSAAKQLTETEDGQRVWAVLLEDGELAYCLEYQNPHFIYEQK